MQYRKLGASGLRVSAIGLGCNPFGNEVDPATAQAIVDKAIDLGVNYFDTADSYYEGRSEEYLGRALKGRRQAVIVATKVGNRVGPGPNDVGTSRNHIVESCEASLRRLQTDFIDVYQIHSHQRPTGVDEGILYGDPVRRMLPTLVHPNEILDGAVGRKEEDDAAWR